MELYEKTEADADTTGLNDYLQELLKAGAIDGDAAGVTRQVVVRGLETLSSKQRALFMAQVIDVYARERCERCYERVEWSEMREALDDGYCSGCRYQWEKVMRE